MTGAFLEDRFRLEATYEHVEGPVYALVTERAGLWPFDGRLGIRPSESKCAADHDNG
jgi:hypothetical protein